MNDSFILKDSGNRQHFDSGMRRDTQDGKPRVDLIEPLGQPYTQTMRYRRGMAMAAGCAKYGDRNWEKADSWEEYYRFLASYDRHSLAWRSGERDEDHAAQAQFNQDAAEWLRRRLLDRGDPDPFRLPEVGHISIATFEDPDSTLSLPSQVTEYLA